MGFHVQWVSEEHRTAVVHWPWVWNTLTSSFQQSPILVKGCKRETSVEFIRTDRSGLHETLRALLGQMWIKLVKMDRCPHDFSSQTQVRNKGCLYLLGSAPPDKWGSFLKGSILGTESLGIEWLGCITRRINFIALWSALRKYFKFQKERAWKWKRWKRKIATQFFWMEQVCLTGEMEWRWRQGY